MKLVAAAVAYGLVAALVFRLTTNVAALGIVFRRIRAHFLEFRLFFDEPRLIWQAQKALLRANLRLLLLILPAMLIMVLPSIWIFQQFDRAPLTVGDPTVVTAQLADAAVPVSLKAPPEVAIETPPIHIPQDRQVAWRIRLLRPSTERLYFTAMPSSNVLWLKVDYPTASYWWIFWFLVISTITTWIATRSAALQQVPSVLPSARAKG
jgi:hypothetical protein